MDRLSHSLFSHVVFLCNNKQPGRISGLARHFSYLQSVGKSVTLGQIRVSYYAPPALTTSPATKYLNNGIVDRCASNHTSSQTNALKWSYIHGSSSVPLLGTTIGKCFQERVESNPDRTAVVFVKDGISLTFGEVLEKADMLAAGLLSLGVRKGDRVGIWGPNTVEWVIAQYGTARAGNVLVNINPSYRPSELKYALGKAGCKLLIAATGYKNANYLDMLREIIPELDKLPPGTTVDSKELPSLKYIVTMGPDTYPGTLRFDDVLTCATQTHRKSIFDLQDQLQFDDPINIQFTSGTTGSPKGATLSHHNIINNSYFVGLRCGYHQHDSIICAPVPLYHCFGMVMASLQMITHGATLVWPSPVFDPVHVLKAVETHKCTALYGVPTMFIDILNHPLCDKTDTSSLITGIMAGSPCPIETVRSVLKRMNMHRFTVCYGSTETSPVSFQSTGECTLDKRVSTVGKVLDHTEAKVIDFEGQIVPVGVTGELCTRGRNNMLGYWEDPEKTTNAITSDNWYHTGDLAVMSEDGYCSIVGRIKDMLIRGGENIYPLEIEQALYKHPKVKDVQVIGVPDARLGEQVCAWIIVKDGMTLAEEEVRDFCKDKGTLHGREIVVLVSVLTLIRRPSQYVCLTGLASEFPTDKMAKFKIPHYILFVDGFPTTVTGKIQKFVMRKETIKRFGLSQS